MICWLLAALALAVALPASAQNLEYKSRFIRAQMAADQPNFAVLSVDSLGQNKLADNSMLSLAKAARSYVATRNGDIIEYREPGAQGPPAWSFRFTERAIVIRSSFSEKNPPRSLVLNFDPEKGHATLLGLLTDSGMMRLPAILHFPDHGTFRITSPQSKFTSGLSELVLGYDAVRGGPNVPGATSEDLGGAGSFVRVTFPPATERRPQVEYRLETTAIYPDGPGIDNNPLYDGYRRDFLNILQLNPRRRVLANNAASDACAFTVFEYSRMAVRMPQLAEGLRASDILRQSLDRYVGGMKGYGMKFYDDDPGSNYDYLDTFPSLVMAASDYVQATHDTTWLKRDYSVIRSWADKMIEFDRDGDGLMEFPMSGNSGTWTKNWDLEIYNDPHWASTQPVILHSSNWWDTVGFGHKDAYSNALAYKAFKDVAVLAREAGHNDDAQLFEHRAEMLRASYFKTFYNPATGVIAGWKSADGKLHDYYFLFVNGAAVTSGVLTREQGNQVWDKLLAKMKAVGYHNFQYGLPGNLIPIRQEDYTVKAHGSGGSLKADGSDGFQYYENGGATASFAYFTVQALLDLGRQKDADEILYPMLKAFAAGGFQGHGANGDSNDWKSWDGTPRGYEGLLVDGYLTLLAAAPGSAHPGSAQAASKQK